MTDDAILNAEGSKVVIERTDAPTAEQIAVIWISDEGEAPKIQGFNEFTASCLPRTY
jgi:hypothetical protein